MNASTPGAALVRLRFPLQALFLIVILAIAAVAQSPNGTITGLVLDSSGGAIVGAELLVASDATGIRYPGVTILALLRLRQLRPISKPVICVQDIISKVVE